MYGGAGADTFVFVTEAESGLGGAADTISGFTPGTDRLDLHAIDANRALAGDQAFFFAGVKPSAHAVWFDVSSAGLTLYGDTGGDAEADFEIVLLGLHSLEANDLWL